MHQRRGAVGRPGCPWTRACSWRRSRAAPESVDLYLSAPAVPAAIRRPLGLARTGRRRGAPRGPAARRGGGGWTCARWARRTLWAAAALLTARPRGECWRLTFSRPLRVHEPVVLHAVLTPKPGEDGLAVPLTAVLGASRMEGEATLHLAAASPLQVEMLGSARGVAGAARPHGASAWRTFRYSGAAVGLTLIGPLQGGDRPPEAVVDRAALTTYVGADGGLEHHYAFQISHWSQNTLPLQMPRRRPADRVPGGRRLVAAPAAVEDGPGGPVIDLPAPRGRASRRPPGRTATRWSTRPRPRRPGCGRASRRRPRRRPSPPAAFQRLWRLAPEFSPLGDDRLRRRPGPGEGTPCRGAARATGRPVPRGPSAGPRLAVASRLGRGAAAPRRCRTSCWASAARRRRQSRSAPSWATRPARLAEGGEFLVVDAAALREAGVDPSAAVTLKPESAEDEAAPWEELGWRRRFAARRLPADDAAPAGGLARGGGRRRSRGGRGGRRRGGALGPRLLRPVPGRGRRGRAPPKEEKPSAFSRNGPRAVDGVGAGAGRRGTRPPGDRPPSAVRGRGVGAGGRGRLLFLGRAGAGSGRGSACCCSGWPRPGWVCSGCRPPCRGWRGRPCCWDASPPSSGACGRRCAGPAQGSGQVAVRAWPPPGPPPRCCC